MKRLFCLVLLCVATVSLTSCSKEENRIKKLIIGTWDATQVQNSSGDWISIPSSRYSISMTFFDDGRYYGQSDYFGSGYGTYDITNKTIKTYVDGKYMYTYRVNSISETNAEVTMTDDDSSSGASLNFRLRKR